MFNNIIVDIFIYYAFHHFPNTASSIIVFCDISKAFDRVWHKALIIKLQSYGITGDLLHWLDDYVSDRKQKVVVNNECSNPNTVKAGVPRGSVLGILLFLLYINDIADNLGNLARLFAERLYAKPYQMPLIYHKIQ
jgi:hypothetical protein